MPGLAVLDTPRELDAREASTFYRMRRTISQRAKRNRLRTAYVDSKKRLDRIGFSIPPGMEDWQTPIGWADKAVTVPASRIRPDGFTLPRESSLMDDIEEAFEDNHLRSVERLAIEASLIHPAFIFVTPGDDAAGEPDVMVTARTGLEATAELDPRTGRRTAALELIGKNAAILYMLGVSVHVEVVGGKWRVTAEYRGVQNLVPCIPYVWGKRLDRPFGRSRVTRPLMGYIDQGVRTMLRQDVTAEFFSRPQRALLGADETHFRDEKGNRISPWDAITGGVWALPDVWDDEEGKLVRPTLTQLQQASMQPHSEMLRTIGLMVSSETSIPVNYLGIIHDNPASADAILANESDMVAMIGHECDLSYKASHEDLGRTILAVKHGEMPASMIADLRGLSSHFADPGTPTRAARADSAVKYVQAFPDGDPEVAMEEYGLSKEQINRNLAYAKRNRATEGLSALIASAKSNPAPVFSDGSQPSVVDDQLKQAQVLKAQADALGTLRRAGVRADDAAARAGLTGLEFIPGNPITIREDAP